MRITNRMMISQFNTNLSANQAKMIMYQQMMSTGKRISKPSDDPVSIIDSLRLRTRINEVEKFSSNISDGASWLDSADSSMSQMTTVMHRVRELALQGSNGTLSYEARIAVSAEVRQMVEQSKVVANTAHGDKYLYAGTNYTEKAFENRRWYGNDNDVNLEIGVGVNISVNTQMREFFMGNNYYDVMTDRMPKGQFDAKMVSAPLTRVDNATPNTWVARTTDPTDVYNGFNPATYVTSTLPVASAAHNVGAEVKMEVAEINYSAPTVINEVKVNISYRRHDSISGDVYDETKQVSLTSAGGGIFQYAAPIAMDNGNVVVGNAGNWLSIDSAATDFAVGYKMIVEDTPTAGGNPANLGAVSTVESYYQQTTVNGPGLIDDASVVAAAGYNNYNASLLFEVVQVDSANNQVQVKVKGHVIDKFTGEHKYFDDLEKVWLKTNGTANYVDLVTKDVKTAYKDFDNLTVPTGESPYKYYDFNSQYQLSQMKLQDINKFKTGDQWIIQTTPPLNDPVAEDKKLVVDPLEPSKSKPVIRSGQILGPGNIVIGGGTNTLDVTISGTNHVVTLTGATYNTTIDADMNTLAADIQTQLNAGGAFGAGAVTAAWNADINRIEITNNRNLDPVVIATTGGSTALNLTAATGAKTFPARDDMERQWVFAKAAIDDASSLGLNTFYLGDKGASNNSSLDIPMQALLDSREVVNWETSSTFMNGVKADGLPDNYHYTVTTQTGLAAATNALIEPNSGAPNFFGQPTTEYIQKAGITQLTDRTEGIPADQAYNGDIMMEVVDKAGNEVTFKVSSHQVAKDGTHNIYSSTVTLTADGATDEDVAVGNITINDIRLIASNNITVGDKMIYHVTATAAIGDSNVVLQGTHSSDATQDFSRNWVLSSNAKFPLNMDMSFFNLETDTGECNSANLTMDMKGISNNDTASFETGINFDTENVGIFQIFRSLATDLERDTSNTDPENMDSELMLKSVYETIASRVTEIDFKMSFLLDSQSRTGAKSNRLEMQKNRLEEAKITYNDLLSKAEDADMEEVIMELTNQENVYKAALATGARVIQPSLIDFLK
ncbi:MAG: flagellar hook-associated protein FlgL [Acidobacteriota bacterium]